MIARLTLNMDQRRVIATLEDDLQWCCDDLVTEAFLNSAYGPGYAPSSDAERTSHPQVYAAADAVERAGWNVEVWFARAEQDAA